MKVEVTRFDGLAMARKVAGQAIDEAAEAARGRHVTLGGGQAMEYLEAYRQARAKVEARGPDAALSLPMLASDVAAGVERKGARRAVNSELDAAEGIIEAHEAWLVISTAIRQARLGGKALVAAASTQREVAELRDQAVAALAQI